MALPFVRTSEGGCAELHRNEVEGWEQTWADTEITKELARQIEMLGTERDGVALIACAALGGLAVGRLSLRLGVDRERWVSYREFYTDQPVLGHRFLD